MQTRSWQKASLGLCIPLTLASLFGCGKAEVENPNSRRATKLVDEINTSMASGDLERARKLSGELNELHRQPANDRSTNIHTSARFESDSGYTDASGNTPQSPQQQLLQSQFDDATENLYLLFTLAFGQAKCGEITSEEFANAAVNLAGAQLVLTSKVEEYNSANPSAQLKINSRHRWHESVDHLVEEVIPRR